MANRRRIRDGLNEDNVHNWRYTGPMRLDKAVHTLEGLLKGIASDGVVTDVEVGAVRSWMDQYEAVRDRHPFTEVLSALDQVLEDGIIDEEELKDILWLCDRFTTANEYFSAITADMQRLQGILGGVTLDGKITKEELTALGNWMQEHEHLKGCWPYDEIEGLITSVLQDGVIDEVEHRLLVNFFSEFLDYADNRAISIPDHEIMGSVTGVCTVCPEINFEENVFCFTGKSSRMTRIELEEIVRKRGGSCSRRVTSSIDYLVIGVDGNPAWAFACYGRKVEEAIKLRRSGNPLLLVHENDFWDAIADSES